MQKNKITCLALSLVLGVTPLVTSIKAETNNLFQAEQSIEEVRFEKDYDLKQIEKLGLEAKQKREEEERKQRELEQRRLEELSRTPHFNPSDVRELSNLSREQVYKMLEGTALVTLADAFYWYEQEYKVNLIFLASIVALESSWGRSDVAIGYNNLTGYMNGGDYTYFTDWGQSLDETFKLIGNEYVNPNGLFYNGVSIYDINVLYCELGSWTDKITNIGYEFIDKINK